MLLNTQTLNKQLAFLFCCNWEAISLRSGSWCVLHTGRQGWDLNPLSWGKGLLRAEAPLRGYSVQHLVCSMVGEVEVSVWRVSEFSPCPPEDVLCPDLWQKVCKGFFRTTEPTFVLQTRPLVLLGRCFPGENGLRQPNYFQ